MKLQHWLISSLASLSMVNCIGEASNKQFITNSIIASVTAPIALNQMQTSAQFAKSSKQSTIKSGTFVSGEHKTQGTVRITTQDGKSLFR